MEPPDSATPPHDLPHPQDNPPANPKSKGKQPIRKPTSQSPPTSNQSEPTTHLQTTTNTFDTSFAAALASPPTAYDGHADDDSDERTPLLDAYYNPSSKPLTAKRSRTTAPLPHPGKANPSRGICLWHEVSRSSQYTRPAAEILREVLGEQRVGSAGEGAGGDNGRRVLDGRDSQASDPGKGKRRWLSKVFGRRGGVE